MQVLELSESNRKLSSASHREFVDIYVYRQLASPNGRVCIAFPRDAETMPTSCYNMITPDTCK